MIKDVTSEENGGNFLFLMIWGGGARAENPKEVDFLTTQVICYLLIRVRPIIITVLTESNFLP